MARTEDKAEVARPTAFPPLEWTRELPTEAGLYLRNNPVVRAILKAPIINLDGELYTQDGEGNLVLLSKRAGAWLWFGPIPKVPKQEPGT